jgi:hypothetical protein
MKSPEETAEWLIGLIVHIYSRPQMYAVTKNDLNNQLRMLHFTLAFVTDREDEYRRASEPMHHPSSIAMSPDGFYDQIRDKSELEPRPALAGNRPSTGNPLAGLLRPRSATRLSDTTHAGSPGSLLRRQTLPREPADDE